MALCLRRGVQSRLLQGRGVWTVLSTVVWGWESGWLGPTHGKAVRKDHTLCSGSPVVARGCGGGRLVFVAQLSPLDCARPVPQNDWRASGPTLCCCLVAVTHTSPRGKLDRRRTAPPARAVQVCMHPLAHQHRLLCVGLQPVRCVPERGGRRRRTRRRDSRTGTAAAASHKVDVRATGMGRRTDWA